MSFGLAIQPSWGHFVVKSACLTLTELAVFSYIRGRAVAFEISIQVSAGASILTWLSGTVIYICKERELTVSVVTGLVNLGQFESRLEFDV